MEVTLFPAATDIEFTDRLTPPQCGVVFTILSPKTVRNALPSGLNPESNNQVGLKTFKRPDGGCIGWDGVQIL